MRTAFIAISYAVEAAAFVALAIWIYTVTAAM